jgi:hypothetical protein
VQVNHINNDANAWVGAKAEQKAHRKKQKEAVPRFPWSLFQSNEKEHIIQSHRDQITFFRVYYNPDAIYWRAFMLYCHHAILLYCYRITVLLYYCTIALPYLLYA